MIAPPPPPTGPPASPGVDGWPPGPASSSTLGLSVLAGLVAAVPLALALWLAIGVPDFFSPLGGTAASVAWLLALTGVVALCAGLTRWVRPAWIGLLVAGVWLFVGTTLVILLPAMILIGNGLRED